MLQARFSEGVSHIALPGITQWDKGRSLILSWDNMPDTFQVHFAYRDEEAAVVVDAVSENDSCQVNIPDELLTKSQDIFAWIYLLDNEGKTGKSIKKVTLYIKERARPKGYIEDLVPSHQQIVESLILELKSKLDHALENGVNSEYVPSYVTKQTQALALKLLSCQNNKSFSFILAGDALISADDYYGKKSLFHMSSAARLLSSLCKIDFAAFLGGSVKSDSDKDIGDAKADMCHVNKALNEAFEKMPSLRIYGESDLLSESYYRNSAYITCKELYPLFALQSDENMVCHSEDVFGGYGYIDFEKHKLRIIMLNTSDFKAEETVTPETDKAKISPQQLSWLCSSLDMSEKSDAQSWRSIILSHHPLNWYNNFDLLREIIRAYIVGEDVELLTQQGEKISYSFAGKNSASILACFNAHLGNYKVNTDSVTELSLVSIPAVSPDYNNIFAADSYTTEENLLYGEEATFEKVADTGEDTAFCVVTLDFENNKIYIHHYGAGYDRELTFEGNIGSSGDDVTIPDTPSDGTEDNTGEGDDNTGEGDDTGTYTNLVPTSTDEYSDIYNDCGYADGEYIDEYGETAAYDGACHTGFITAVSSDVIRISGGQWQSSEVNRLLIYDSGFNVITSLALSGSGTQYLSYTDGVATFTPSAYTETATGSMAYIRVSALCAGETLIVTRNEKISSSSSETPPATQYTNIISYATDDIGEVYNDSLGYMDDYIIDENGDVDEYNMVDGATHTGFLYGEKGSVFRFKGYGFSSQASTRIAFYDELYECIAVIEIPSAADDSANGISFDNSVMKLDTSAVTAFSVPDTFFIRLSTAATGADLIITYNEELS